MTERSILTLLGVRNADQAARQIERFGDRGQNALRRVETASRPLNASLLGLNRTMGGLRGGIQSTARAVAVFEGPLGGTAGRLSAIGSTLGSVNPLMLGFGGAAAAAAFGLVKVIGAGNEFEKSQFRIQQLLKTTESSSGLTAKQIDKLAVSLADATLTSAKEAREAAASLLTFRSVAGDAFGETLVLAQDLAAAGFGTLQTNVVQLGKALEDPVKGLNALRRSGVSFTQAQRGMIKELVETNRLAEAQAIILETLRGQVGGAGDAEAGGLAGAFDTLGERMGRAFEILNEKLGASSNLTSFINVLNAGLKEAIDDLAPTLERQLANINRELASLPTVSVQDPTAGEFATQLNETAAADAEFRNELERQRLLRERAGIQREIANDALAEAGARQQSLIAEQERTREAELAAAAAEREAKAKAAQKEFERDRTAALREIVKLEEAAATAGLEGESLILAERERRLDAFKELLEREIISEGEAARARAAIVRQSDAELFEFRSAQIQKAAAEEKAATEKLERDKERVRKEAQRKAERDIREFNRKVEAQAREISGGLTEALFDGFDEVEEKGLSVFESIFESAADFASDFLRDLAKRFLEEKIILPLVLDIVGGNAGSLGGQGQGGGIGDLFDLAQKGGDLFDLFGGGGSSGQFGFSPSTSSGGFFGGGSSFIGPSSFGLGGGAGASSFGLGSGITGGGGLSGFTGLGSIGSSGAATSVGGTGFTGALGGSGFAAGGVGAIGTIGGQIGGSLLGGAVTGNDAGAGQGAMIGALGGAAIGTLIFPGVGTAIGGLAGGLLGGLAGGALLGGADPGPPQSFASGNFDQGRPFDSFAAADNAGDPGIAQQFLNNAFREFATIAGQLGIVLDENTNSLRANVQVNQESGEILVETSLGQEKFNDEVEATEFLVRSFLTKVEGLDQELKDIIADTDDLAQAIKKIELVRVVRDLPKAVEEFQRLADQSELQKAAAVTKTRFEELSASISAAGFSAEREAKLLADVEAARSAELGFARFQLLEEAEARERSLRAIDPTIQQVSDLREEFRQMRKDLEALEGTPADFAQLVGLEQASFGNILSRLTSGVESSILAINDPIAAREAEVDRAANLEADRIRAAGEAAGLSSSEIEAEVEKVRELKRLRLDAIDAEEKAARLAEQNARAALALQGLGGLGGFLDQLAFGQFSQSAQLRFAEAGRRLEDIEGGFRDDFGLVEEIPGVGTARLSAARELFGSGAGFEAERNRQLDLIDQVAGLPEATVRALAEARADAQEDSTASIVRELQLLRDEVTGLRTDVNQGANAPARL